jgi:alpha-amylase
MCTKFFADGDMHGYFNPFNSPYDAFINYMNVLSDFKLRINALKNEVSQSVTIENELHKKDQLIKKYKAEINQLKKQMLQA